MASLPCHDAALFMRALKLLRKPDDMIKKELNESIKSKSFADADNSATCAQVFKRMVGAHNTRLDGINACKTNLEDKMLSMQEEGATLREISRVQSMLVLVTREGKTEGIMNAQNEKLWNFKCGEL